MSSLFLAAVEIVTPLLYTVDGKMSDKTLKQQININFCVRIGKSTTEMSSHSH
jgi:hypothetical protein